jgi:hypothetical protein
MGLHFQDTANLVPAAALPEQRVRTLVHHCFGSESMDLSLFKLANSSIPELEPVEERESQQSDR